MTTALPSSDKTPLSTPRSLARLVPYAKPALLPMLASALTAGVATVCALIFPLVIGHIIDGPVATGDKAGLWWPSLLLIGLGVTEAALFFTRRMIIARPAMRVESQMRTALYNKLQHLPMSFHGRWSAGQLLSRAISDLAMVRRFLSFALIFLFVNIMMLLIGTGILVWISWQIGLLMVALFLPLMVISFIFESKYRVLSRSTQDQVGDLATLVEESVLGIRIAKAFGRKRYVAAAFEVAAQQLYRTQLMKAKVLAWLWAAIVALPEIALGFALLLGIRQVVAGDLSAGSLVSFFLVAMTLRWPVDSIGWLLAIANETAAATERFFEVMDEPDSLTSPDNPRATTGGSLEFRQVGFVFDDAHPQQGPLLREMNLTLDPGQSVALVGATGSGKTTITALVNRLHDVSAGAILLGGVDLRDLALDDLRRRVTVAFEEPTLFSASVRENILLGFPEGTETDVARALEIAQAEFCYDLPFGLDTRIGEQGLSLSGGQRQRLALARAVVSSPEVLILDDPLSALDIHTEAAVEAALRSVLASTTSLIVAHRASTVLLADRVALLQDGTITALGTHSDLMASNAAYADLLASLPDRTPTAHETASEVTSG